MSRKHTQEFDKRTHGSTGIYCTFRGGLPAFSHAGLFLLALVILLFTGFGMMVLLTSSNSVLQTIVGEDKRGRVMSFCTMAFMGTVPFGNLV